VRSAVRAVGFRLPLVLLFVLVVAGCGLIDRAVATPTPPPIMVDEVGMPSPASLWISAEPEVADGALSVVLLDPDDPAFRQEQRFEPGEIVRGQFFVSTGRYRLDGLNGACATDVLLGPELETDVAIRVAADGTCTFAIGRVHGPEFAHEEGRDLTVRVTAEPGGRLSVDLRSLDTPANPVPAPVLPGDEPGLAKYTAVWPGQYEVSLLRDGVVIETTEVTVEPAEPVGAPLEVEMDGIDD
jgi:hypothetical protein